MTRMTSEDRVEHLLDAALTLASKAGWENLTRDGIGDAASVSYGLVTQRLGTMIELRRKVMRRAIKLRCLPVVAQGLARGDRTARGAPDDLKREVAAWLATR